MRNPNKNPKKICRLNVVRRRCFCGDNKFAARLLNRIVLLPALRLYAIAETSHETMGILHGVLATVFAFQFRWKLLRFLFSVRRAL